MKAIITVILACVFSISSSGQEIKNVDFISPFHEGIAAVQNGDKWGFINEEGTMIINYRSDLVAQPCEKHPNLIFPKFVQGRALVKEIKDDIIYYGYIDTKGSTVIEPAFINTPHFNKNGLAIVQRLFKGNYGSNDILKKNMVRYTYKEEVIDISGQTVGYLTAPKHILPYKNKMKKAPAVTSLLLSTEWAAAQNEELKYNLIRLNIIKTN